MVIPLKKATVETIFYTDGDYLINPDCIDGLGLEHSGGYIIGRVTFDKNSPDSICNNPWYAVRDYLQKLIVSFDVSYTHYYVLAELYNMVNGVLVKLYDRHLRYDGVYHIDGSISGNYDGTEIHVILERDMDAPNGEPLEILNLRDAIYKALHDVGIFDISELCNLTSKEVRAIYGIGNGYRRQILRALELYGRSLKE